MADYPTTINAPRAKANKSGVIYDAAKTTVPFVEDMQNADDEIVAIETDLINASRVRAYRATVDQTIPTGVWTKVQLNAESYDLQAEFDPTENYRFTAIKAGYYLIIGVLDWASSVDQSVHVVGFYKSGVLVSRAALRSSGVGGPDNVLSDILYLGVGGYIELYAYQVTGGDVDLFAGEYQTFMSIHKLPA